MTVIVVNLPQEEPLPVEAPVIEEPSVVAEPMVDPQPDPIPDPTMEESSIDSLADLIGAGAEAKLLSFLQGGVSVQELRDFLDSLGAEQVATVEDALASFEVHQITRQDKQLHILTKQTAGNDLLQLVFAFGEIRDIPRPLEIKRAFEE